MYICKYIYIQCMPQVITHKLIRRSSIRNCYKANYVKEHQEFVVLDNYIRLQGDNFEGKLLCGGSALGVFLQKMKNKY